MCPACTGRGRVAVFVQLPNGRAGARLDPCACAPGAVLDPGGLELGPALTRDELAELAGQLGRHELLEEEQLDSGEDRGRWRQLDQKTSD